MRSVRVSDRVLSCSVDDGVPDCSAGPLGRVRFVAHELADLCKQAWGTLRHRSTSR